jgi:16S rRNA (cytosine967-C5)-methyltransferase
MVTGRELERRSAIDICSNDVALTEIFAGNSPREVTTCMPVSPARIAAFDVLLRVDRDRAYAIELLHSPQLEKLSSIDRALATELVMGVLRWKEALDRRIAEHSSQPLASLDLEVLTALRLATYQLQFLSRVPPRAAVHESVELVKRARKRSAATFVNAVLRKLASDQPPGTPDVAGALDADDLASRSAHPFWLVERWEREFGLNVARRICEYDQRIPQTSVRLRAPEVENELARDGIALASSPLLASSRRVLTGDITKTAAFRERRIAVQDDASQLVALLVGQGSRVLDCCAAPGGKTRVLAQRNPSSEVMAVDLHPHRARLLRELVPEKQVHVIAADVRQLPLDGGFDRVLADVPCSGTGTLAHNPEIKWKLEPKDLADLQQRQLAILSGAMRQVARGGKLVYSTCSLERGENREVIEQAVAEDSSFHVLDCRLELKRLQAEGELAETNLDSLLSGPYLRTIPGVQDCDGFFAAILQKA